MSNNVRNELLDERAFNEGLQEHIGDLLESLRPLIETHDENKITIEQWNKLYRAYAAARSAMCINDGVIHE